YVEAIRSVQTEGPYYLGGYSAGGLIAFEMARQLHASGSEIALVAIVDGNAPADRRGPVPWTPVRALRFVKNLGFWVLDDLIALRQADVRARVASRLRRLL